MITPEYLNDEKIQTFFSEASDGNMSLEDGYKLKVRRNIMKFLQQTKIKSSQVYPIAQEHSDNIIAITKQNKIDNVVFHIENYFKCDALFTNQKNVALFLSTGDCIPLVITDKERSFVGLVHLGWKSTDLSLPTKAVEFAKDTYNVKANEMEFLIGPAIRKNSYTYKGFSPTNPEVWKGFVKLDETILEHIDNVGAVRRQLIMAGGRMNYIFDMEMDTYTDPRFFSHLRDYTSGSVDKGRIGTLAILK